MTLDEAMLRVENEYLTAAQHHSIFTSMHEGFAVIHEEFDELKAEVWKNPRHADRQPLAQNEAVQLAAMALRFLIDCC